MPYISALQIAAIRAELKSEFPEIKFSITREHHSGVRVRIMESPYFADGLAHSLNTFYLKDQETHPEILIRIHQIMATGQRELVNDADYGSVPTFYTWMEIGNSYGQRTHVKTILMNLNQVAMNAYNKRMAESKRLALVAEKKKAQDELALASHMVTLYPTDEYYQQRKASAETILGMAPAVPVRTREENLEIARKQFS